MKKLLLFILIVLSNTTYAQLGIFQPSDLETCSATQTATFDLTQTIPEILGPLDPLLHTVQFYESNADATANVNPIPNPNNFVNSVSLQTIYVRAWENADPTFFGITSFNIVVNQTPDILQPDNLLQFQFPFTGNATFDLTENQTEMLNGLSLSEVDVSYYLTLADAQTQSNAIANSTNFTNTTNPQTIYVTVSDFFSGCFTTTSFDLEVIEDIVNIPDTNFLNALIQDGVDTNSSGDIQFSEAEAVINLNVENENISDLTGIEAFVNLLNFSFSSNPVGGDLDFSNNPLLELLIFLNCEVSTVNLTNNTNLVSLFTYGTPLLEIDVTNNTLLEVIGISGSEIETLDFTHNINLTELYIASNPSLETVFIKNGSDESANMDSGSWSENWGFGNNPSLEYVCADADQVAEIQAFAGTDYVVNSFCDFQPGGDFNSITGVVQVDLNNDGCDPLDPFVPYLNIDAGPGPSTLVPAVSTDSIGVYNIYIAQTGNLTVQPNLENPNYFNINPDFPVVNIPFIDNSSTTLDFCLTANGEIADAEVAIAPVFPSRPGFDATYKLVYKNKGNQVLSGSVDFQYDDSVLDYISSTESPDLQSTGVLSFNFTNLEPFESRYVDITLNVNGPTETPPINIDDVLDYTGTITIDQTEETPADNTFDYSEIVVGAFDPNDITCLQGDLVPDTQIGEFLHYMIRFENTGNAPAEFVIVATDINPADYDISTLQVLNASHDMYIRNNDGFIEFVFEDIQLEGGGGHGNILLKIETRPDLTITDEVDAQADIYFDFNFPIVTNIANTAFTVLSTNQFNAEQDISLYPNPGHSEINIETSTPIQSMTIYDLQGRIVLSEPNIENTMKLRQDISNLGNGVYVIKIVTSKGQASRRLIKE